MLLYASAPSWWSQRGVLVQNAAIENYGPANQGQVKNIAKSAVAEMDAKLPGGAGDVLHNLIVTWSIPSSQTNDFTPVTLGQLKNVAKPFYERLIVVRYVETYPWIASGAVPDDFGMVNIGQIKNLFSFDLLATDAVHDADANGLPDWWEKYYFGNVGVDPNAAAPRGDGLTNLQAFLQQLDPINDGRILSINPERIDETVPTGQIVTRTISVTNTTNAARQLTFSPHAAPATVNYSYTNSDQDGGPEFVWNDISSTGVHMDSVSDADNGFESFPLSFPFPYYGNSYTTVYVASDGFVTFGGGSDNWWGGAMPDSRSPAAMIAAFEDDLDLGESGDVYYQDYGDHVIIQFENAVRYYGDGYVTFQIVLQRGGTIIFYYKDMEGTVDGAVVGIQNLATNQGLTIAYYQSYLKSDLAIRITPSSEWQPAPWLQVAPAAMALPPGATAELSVTLDGRTLVPGLFAGGVTISSDEPSITPREIPVTMTLVDESQLDNDRDGLTNGQERALRTDLNKIDTDGDGVPDGWEVAHGLSPLVNDASGDPDGDGFTNLQEYENQTDPLAFAAPARVIETFDNWNYVVAQSGDWQLDATNPDYFDGDTSRATRNSATTGSLTYWMPALVSIDVTVYYKGNLMGDQIRLSSSPDNASWAEVAVSKVADWDTGGDWHGAVFRQRQGFSSDMRYIRIDVSGADTTWTPQLSRIVFVHTDLNRPVADSRNVTVSAGAALAIRLTARDADADPLIYRVIEQPSHGALSGAPPNLTYTGAVDYIGQDRFSFVANDGVRDSAPANIYITVQAPPPAPPTDLTFIETSSSSASLTWAGQTASRYIIERSLDGGLTWQQIGDVNGATTSFTDSTYVSGAFYSYRVRAKGQTASLSEPSSQVSSKGTDPTITDSDGDGVVDSLEAQRHSNPDRKDTDGDGAPDGEDGAPANPTRWAKPIERRYAVIDLGVLPGTTGSSPIAINNAGHVLCASGEYGRNFIWLSGERRQLPGNFTPSGFNDSDTVVGDTTYFYAPYSQTVTNGAYWSNGQVIRLPQLMVGYPGYPQYQTYTSSGRAINNAGEIVGWSSPDGSSLFATKWVAGGVGTALPAPISFKVWPFAISDSGAVLAAAQTDSGYDIDLLPATRLAASRDANATFNGYGINSTGVIVSRGRQIWPQGATAGAQDVNTLLAPESATTIDFIATITNTNEILADAHDGTGNADLVVLHLASANSPAQLYKVLESDPRIEWIYPQDMNDDGLIVGTASHNDGTPDHAIMLVPSELMMDGNRDGEMSFTDPVVHESDQTSEEKPYRFWVNDDQDAVSGTNLSEEVTPPLLLDNQDEKIQSIRDCEDLARLWLNIRGLTEGFKTGAIKLVLKFRNVKSGNPAVRVFRAVENGGRGYLTSEAWATLQVTPPFDHALPGANGPGIASPTSGIYVDRQFWGGIDESDPIINLLFEGVEEGKGELYFEIIKGGQRIGTSPGVWLDVKNIRKMYERAKAQPENVVAPYAVQEAFTGPVNYIADPNGHPFDKPWDETDQCVVFVHGWNVSYDEYLGVAETMFKRLWHQGFKGHFASFRWDTRKSDGMFDTGEYNRSESRAYLYGAALKQWVTNLSDNYTVSLIAHSMGNVVSGEALREGMLLRNYLLMEAAVPISCYDANVAPLARLVNKDVEYPTPDYHIDPFTNESTLGYRGYLGGVSGNFINFHNPDDWALASGFTIGLETNWEKNQIDYKPDGAIPGAIHAGTWMYHYDSSRPAALPLVRRAWVMSSVDREVTDSWEMKAFVARSRTKAVGALENGNVVFAQSVNLSKAPYSFGRERSDHSGQFTRDIQKVDALYKAIHQALKE